MCVFLLFFVVFVCLLFCLVWCFFFGGEPQKKKRLHLWGVTAFEFSYTQDTQTHFFSFSSFLFKSVQNHTLPSGL